MNLSGKIMAVSVHERFHNVRAQLEEPLSEDVAKSVEAARQGVFRGDGRTYEDILFKHVDFRGRKVRVLKPQPMIPRGNQEHDPMKKNHDAFIGMMTGDARLMGDTERAYRMKRGGAIQFPVGVMQRQNAQPPTIQEGSSESEAAQRHRRADAMRVRIGEADQVRPVTGRNSAARDIALSQQVEASTAEWRHGRETQDALVQRISRDQFGSHGVPTLTIPQYASRDTDAGVVQEEDRRRVTVLSQRDKYDTQQSREYDDADEVAYVSRNPLAPGRQSSFREHGTTGRIAIESTNTPTQAPLSAARTTSVREHGTQQGSQSAAAEGLEKNPAGDRALAVARLLSTRERDQRPARWGDSMGDQSPLEVPGSRPTTTARTLSHRESHTSSHFQASEDVSATASDFAIARARKASNRDGDLYSARGNDIESSAPVGPTHPLASARRRRVGSLLKGGDSSDVALDLGDAQASMSRKVSSRIRTEVRGAQPASDLVGSAVDVLGDSRGQRKTLEEQARATNRMRQMGRSGTTRIQQSRAHTDAVRWSDPAMVNTMDRLTERTRGGDRAHVLAGRTSWEAHAQARMQGLQSHFQAAERARQSGGPKMPFYESEAETDYDSELD